MGRYAAGLPLVHGSCCWTSLCSTLLFRLQKYLTAKNLSIDVAEEVDEDEAVAVASVDGENSLALQVIAGLGGREKYQGGQQLYFSFAGRCR